MQLCIYLASNKLVFQVQVFIYLVNNYTIRGIMFTRLRNKLMNPLNVFFSDVVSGGI